MDIQINRRSAHYPIDPVFMKRWSPRSFKPVAMPPEDLMALFEAARWAPSAYNIQPWRFLYEHRDGAMWRCYLELLDPFNAAWAKNASALVFLLSERFVKREDDRPPRPSRTNSLDAGAAWAHFALQAAMSGYHTHAMAGVNFDLVHEALGVPDTYRVEMAIAVGAQADRTDLPGGLREREYPSCRRPVRESAFRGAMPAAATAADIVGQGR